MRVDVSGRIFCPGGSAELKRLKELEAENAKLKRMCAELALENTAINFLAENSDAVGRSRKRCPRPPAAPGISL
jgi:hypothetical protein